MTVTNTNDGNWQISQGTKAEVLAEVRAHCVNGPISLAYDSNSTNWVAIFKIERGTE